MDGGVWQGIDYNNSTLFKGLTGKLGGLGVSGNGYQGAPAAIVNLIIPYILVLAGLILFATILIAGYNMLTSFGDENKINSAKKMLTNAAMGFGIIFISYWLLLLVKTIFGM